MFIHREKTSEEPIQWGGETGIQRRKGEKRVQTNCQGDVEKTDAAVCMLEGKGRSGCSSFAWRYQRLHEHGADLGWDKRVRLRQEAQVPAVPKMARVSLQGLQGGRQMRW